MYVCVCMCACFCVHARVHVCACMCVCVYVHVCKCFFRTNTESSKHSCGMKGPTWGLPAQTCGGREQRGGPELLKAEHRGEHPQKEAGLKVQGLGDQGEWGGLASRWGLTREEHTVSRHHLGDHHMGPETWTWKWACSVLTTGRHQGEERTARHPGGREDAPLVVICHWRKYGQSGPPPRAAADPSPLLGTLSSRSSCPAVGPGLPSAPPHL